LNKNRIVVKTNNKWIHKNYNINIRE
jgi:hypothetical protein